MSRMEREKRIAERKEAEIAAKKELAAREEQMKVQEAKKLAEKKEKDLEERVQRKGVRDGRFLPIMSTQARKDYYDSH